MSRHQGHPIHRQRHIDGPLDNLAQAGVEGTAR